MLIQISGIWHAINNRHGDLFKFGLFVRPHLRGCGPTEHLKRRRCSRCVNNNIWGHEIVLRYPTEQSGKIAVPDCLLTNWPVPSRCLQKDTDMWKVWIFMLIIHVVLAWWIDDKLEYDQSCKTLEIFEKVYFPDPSKRWCIPYQRRLKAAVGSPKTI